MARTRSAKRYRQEQVYDFKHEQQEEEEEKGCSSAPPKTKAMAETHSLCALRRLSLTYGRRVPCSPNESIVGTNTVNSNTHDAIVADNSYREVEAPENLQNDDVGNSKGVDYTKLVYTSPTRFEPSSKRSANDCVIALNAPIETPMSPEHVDSKVTVAISLNLSDMLSLEDDFSSIDSKKNEALATVDGYCVRNDLAPILQGILSKYGDIAANSKKSIEFRSMLLENVCNIVKKLQVTEFVCFTMLEIDSFRVLLKDMECDINVGWLLQRFDQIDEAKVLLRESPSMKEARSQNRHALEVKKLKIQGYEEEFHKLQETIKCEKHEMESMLEEKGKLDQVLSHTKVLMKKFHRGNLADGLI